MSAKAIEVDSLSKVYRIGVREARSETLLGAVAKGLKSPLENLRRLRGLTRFTRDELEGEDVIWALRDVGFSVDVGEVVGIIGANGAGKSTLLKILAGITEPTSGRAIIRGRVGSLLEVGTGMHPELTGRENVYLSGTLLGMKKAEIDRKFDEIVEFAEVEKFIDTPVKRYSSGMKVRLGFAIAAHLEPEILLVDEVLAVGDVAFQQRCIGRMGDVAKGGRTVLFVSHNMNAISRLCSRAILISEGRVEWDGNTVNAITSYLANRDIGNNRPVDSSECPFRLLDVLLTNPDGEPLGRSLRFGEGLGLRVVFEPRKTISRASFFCRIETVGGLVVTTSNSSDRDLWVDLKRGIEITVSWKVPKLPLFPGMYRIVFAIHDRLSKPMAVWWNAGEFSISPVDAPPRFSRETREAGVVFLEDAQWESDSKE